MAQPLEQARIISRAWTSGNCIAKWFATFMPESQERMELVWKASREWAVSDPVRSGEFLKALGIDAEEMMRRE